MHDLHEGSAMTLCPKGLHEMTEENTETYTRQIKGGGGSRQAKRCLTCKMARRKKGLCYEQKIEARQSELSALFEPFKTDGSWGERAGCRWEDPEVMFPDQTYNSHVVKEISARNCSWCPVKEPCLIDALVTPTHGIRGGMLFPGALLKWDHVPLLETLTKRRDGVET